MLRVNSEHFLYLIYGFFLYASCNNPKQLKHFLIIHLGASEWLSWSTLCLWPRSWSQDPRIEPAFRLPFSARSLLILPLALPPPLMFSFSQKKKSIKKINKRVKYSENNIKTNSGINLNIFY